jgi:phosphohistidine phosphatase
MKTLLVLRHGKSSWSDPTLADFDRPLKKRGERDAPRMGRLAADIGLVPDLIATSAAERAIRTAELFAAAAGFDGEMLVTEELYAADPEQYARVLRTHGDPSEVVMVVGHNPGLEALLEETSGKWQRMPTAALAQIRLPIESWSEFVLPAPGSLVGLWRPKELTE